MNDLEKRAYYDSLEMDLDAGLRVLKYGPRTFDEIQWVRAYRGNYGAVRGQFAAKVLGRELTKLMAPILDWAWEVADVVADWWNELTLRIRADELKRAADFVPPAYTVGGEGSRTADSPETKGADREWGG